MKLKITIPPQKGAVFELDKGERVKVIDLEGGQVADLLAFRQDNHEEKLSTGVTIDNNGSLYLKKGDLIYSNRYKPLLLIVDDTVEGHDLLHPPCSPGMYRFQYNIRDNHPSCYMNFVESLKEYGIDERLITTPFNIFMNTRIAADGSVEVKEPLSVAGDYITLEAQADLIVAVTACSVEESACNSYRCTAIGLEVYQQLK